MDTIKALSITVALILLTVLKGYSAEKTTIPAVSQNPPMILGFRAEGSFETPDDVGPNLFNPDGWIVTYGEREGCDIQISGGVITMTRNRSGWPPCGVSQKISGVGVGSKFVFSAVVLENTDKSEVYTDFDSSIFKPGTGKRVDIITSKYKDLTVWLQTYSLDTLPITTTWSEIQIRRLE